jgi:cytochrome c oxidase cbb3-type subunit 2
MLNRNFLLAAAAAAGLAGCGGSQSAGGAPKLDVGMASAQAEATPASARERLDRGRKLFVAECSGCHGERGRGDGPAAVRLDPKPRNFTAEKFKFRSTPASEPPTRQDIFETVSNGLPGSAMPPFKFLTEEERWLLVDYVRSLAGIDRAPAPEPIAMGAEPPGGPESIARGKTIYEKLQCASCHGPEGRGDGPSAKTLKDEYGRPIVPRDLTTGVYRRGETAAALHMRFRSGIDGTPMPSYAAALPEADGWDLTHYVQSLARPRAPLPADLVERGRRVVAEKRCDACHVIEGQGARVGPSLDVSAGKLHYEWARTFLKNPRAAGKIYPYIPYRMPDLGLSAEEVEGVLALFAKIANRPYPEPPAAPAVVDESKIAEGKLIYFLKCTECHNLGNVVPTPEAKRQGPDLIQVSKRLRFEWMPLWVSNPQAVYPDTRMVNTNLTPEQIEAVRAFVWKASVDAKP